MYFDRSRVCYIDGRAGELRYRGYSIHDLAERSTFEETCYLLLKGELPTRAQLDSFTEELKAARALPEGVYEVIRTIRTAHPMDVLRTGVSALSAFDPETADKSPEATLARHPADRAVPIIAPPRAPAWPAARRALPSPATRPLLYMLKGKAASADAAR